MNLVGKIVKHKLLGKGEIIKKIFNSISCYIIVQFQEKTCQFIYPDAFENFLAFEDNELQKKVATEITVKEECQFQENQKELLDFLHSRGIQYLVHFTNIKNVESIKKYGLLSVDELKRRGLTFYSNDNMRWDRCLDYISLSITKVNSNLLSAFRYYGKLDEIAIIYIDAALLYKENKVARIYCDRNAAAKTCRKGDSLEFFKNMFCDELKYTIVKNDIFAVTKTYNRYSLSRKPNETTDPQAEILFEKRIDPKYIVKIEV